MQIDDTDQRLIALLQDNARLPVADLARALGLARTTVKSRLNRLETSGTIRGYTLRPGASLAPLLAATALVAIEPRAGPAVLTRLRALANVRRVHTTSGRFDLLVEITAQTTRELDETLDEIGAARGVRSSESLIHLSTKIDRAG